jgi:hypothetical protein
MVEDISFYTNLMKKYKQKKSLDIEIETWALVSYTPKNKTHKVITNINNYFNKEQKN